MNLNQAAHGDREFGYIQTRLGVARKTVAGHVADPAVRRADRRLGAGGGRLARGALAAAGPVRRQHARRRRHRGRQGRGAAARSACRSTRYGVNDLVAVVRRGRRRRRRRAGRGVRRPLRGGRRAAGRRRAARRRCATPRGSSSGCASFLADGGFGAFTTNFEDLGGAAAAARARRAAADGRRLRLRRRGRLEDRRCCCATLKVDGGRPARRHLVHGGLHLPPRPGPASDPRRAHAGGLPDHRRRRAARARSTRWASAAARTRSGWCSTPRPGPAVVVGLADLGDRFRLVANEIDVVAADRAAAEPAGGARGVGAAAGPAHLGRGLADRRRPAPHRALHGGRRRGAGTTSPTWPAPSCSSSTPTPPPRRFAHELRWNQAYHRLAGAL